MNDDMITNAVDPLILEIFLYKNNYKDRLLITELKERARTVKIPGNEDSAFFVKTDDMYDILMTKFKKDIKDFDSTPDESLHKSATSIYFIDSMISSFKHLKYFKVNVSEASSYTRKINNTINFDFRVMHSKIDLPVFCSPEFMVILKEIFKNLGIYGTNPFDKTPYFEMHVNQLCSKLRHRIAEIDPESEENYYITSFQSLIGTKLEKDNPMLLVLVEK